MSDELTPSAHVAWRIAAAEAGSAGHTAIECAHLLIGILSLEKLAAARGGLDLEGEAMASIARDSARLADVLARAGGDGTSLRRRLREGVGTSGAVRVRGAISRSGACKQAFRRAAELAGDEPTSAVHLAAAFVEEPDAVIEAALAEARLQPIDLYRRLLAFAEEVETCRAQAPAPAEAQPAGSAPGAPTPELDRFGRDLTALAAKGDLGPVVGRRAELLQVLQTLARASKSNPVLVGEAGVGKTAIVEALAIRAAQGKDPAVLHGVRIVELSLSALLGGTSYRGELEKRLEALLRELRDRRDVIVFVDEIHTLVGAGRVGQGGMDAANALKPALARGELRVIGATTPLEYRRFVESDAAFERRFERIDVGEPSREETLEILRGLLPRWEKHHGVRVPELALRVAIDLALRFDLEHHLPDKAVDLVDRAAARTRIPSLSMRLPGAAGSPAGGFASPVTGLATVSEVAIAEVLAEKKGLPLDLVSDGLAGLRPRLLELPSFLAGHVKGQADAIARVARRVQLAHAGLDERRGPLAVFLFLGPTGVGKTELARRLAEFLFGSEAALVRFDMSEYMEEHAVSRLIGAPPGYVGHDEEGQLVARLLSRPYAVVLLDEVEKAHPRVLDLFLQVFDAGRVTDTKGRTADARHAIFVMTSNLGAGAPRERVGFPAAEQIAPDTGMDEVRRFFRPELLNRVSEIVAFRALDGEDARAILRPLLGELAERLRRQHGVALRVDPEAEQLLVEKGLHPAFGARELRRVVERMVQAPLSALVLSGKIRRHAAWRVAFDEGGIYVVPE
jgi:ATP-dependent Clp protease ATP-binding subunit ClpC